MSVAEVAFVTPQGVFQNSPVVSAGPFCFCYLRVKRECHLTQPVYYAHKAVGGIRKAGTFVPLLGAVAMA